MWLDQNKTLLVNRNRDTWQMPVEDSDGDYLGNVVAQVVEPEEYMVRYFLVYDPSHDRRFLLPSDTVLAIDNRIYSKLSANQIALLPEYDQVLERDDEIEIFKTLSETPYWDQ